MAVTAVKTSSAFVKYTAAPRTARMSARLPDGSVLVLTFEATSATASQLKLMYAPNENAAFVEKASWSMGTVAFTNMNASMALDDANNVHVVYQYWSNAALPAVNYVKLTYNATGPAWTVGTAVAVRASGVLDKSTSFDIDVGGAGANARPIIGIKLNTAASTTWRYYMMTAPTTVVELAPLATTRAANTYLQSMIQVTARHVNETDGSIVFAYTLWIGSQGRYYIALAKVTTAGVATFLGNSSLSQIFATNQYNMRMYLTDTREVTCFFWGGDGAVNYLRMSWDAANAVFTRAQGTPYRTPKGTQIANFDDGDVAMIAPRKFMWLTGDANTIVYNTLIDLTANRAIRYNYQKKTSGWTKGMVGIFAGFNRAFDQQVWNPLIIGFAKNAPTTNVLATLYFNQHTPMVPTGVIPADSSTINTDVPALAASLQLDANGNQSSYTVTWQFATDSGFTANVKTETSDLTAAPNTVRDKLSALSRLAQTALYVRAKVTNEWGIDSAWSSTSQFKNEHYAMAINSSPVNGVVIPYAAGQVAFSWTYTDTSEVSTQSAYQIQVVDPTGAVVVDTGKVISAAKTASLIIPSANQDMELDYTIDVWNDQDIQSTVNSDRSRYFFVSTTPAPVLTAPVAGSTVTSGIVPITWNPGLYGVKTQASWRVVVLDSTTKKTVWDSGLVASQDNSVTPPPGTFRNLRSYVVSLYVTDSIGLTNSTITNFAVSFTLPATPSQVYVFPDNYRYRGRVWIGWTNANIDTDFTSWNLYRRVQGVSEWTRLVTYTNVDQPTFGYSDTSATSNTTYQYLVTQITNPNQIGDIVESSFESYYTVKPYGTNYWLSDVNDVINPVPLLLVTGDSYTNETERTVYNIPGRGRKVDLGDELGVAGTLSILLRDKQTGPSKVTNCLADPSMQDGIPFSRWWTLSANTDVSFDDIRYVEESPADHDVSVMASVATGGTILMSQTMPVIPYAGPTDTFSVSTWLGDLAKLWSFTVQAKFEAFTSGNVSLGSQTVTLQPGENFMSHSNWFRYSGSVTGMPANAHHVDVTYSLIDSANTAPRVAVTGFQVTAGILVPYVDGDLRGSYWVAERYKSASSSTGYYTARKQRQDILNIIRNTDDLRLLTPFGDAWSVSTDDTGFNRDAGLGSDSEYGEFSIPYMEVAD